MSTALDDIGVNMHTVQMRRRLTLAKEDSFNIQTNINRGNRQIFILGSQSEGTTTLDLSSDTDALVVVNDFNIMMNWQHWEHNKANALIFKLTSTPSQYYLLQMVLTDTPEPVSTGDFENVPDTLAVLHSDLIVLRSEQFLHDQKMLTSIALATEAKTNGPAVSIENLDFVYALPVYGVLPEIQNFFDRAMSDYWPTPKLLADARHCVNFLIPLGYVFSENKSIEWRLSANLIERRLMFSLNATQLQCYVVLKLLKNSLFKEHISNTEGITSFHCKTVLFFTMAKHPLYLWESQNLFLLIKLCLKTLKSCLQSCTCPHFIMADVNLFDGKLSVLDCQRLHMCVSSIIKNDLRDIFHLDIECLQDRIISYSSGYITRDYLSRRNIHTAIWYYLYQTFICSIYLHNFLCLFLQQDANNSAYIAFIIRKWTSSLELYNLTAHNKRRVAKRYFMDLSVCLATFLSSVCIRLHRTIHPDILFLFQCGFQSDLASNRLKLASMLYCKGHMTSAEYILTVVSRLYRNSVATLCAFDEPTINNTYAPASLNLEKQFIKNQVFCVRFFKKDAYCVPPFLLHDLNKTAYTQNVIGLNRIMVDKFESDALPFLYYLQYLTHGSLGQRRRQLSALKKFVKIVTDKDVELHHPQTATNMLAHCQEMEGNIEAALFMFRESVQKWPGDNIACLHIDRLFSRGEEMEAANH